MALAINPTLNPFRCGGTAMPVNLLVMCKAIAIALLLTGHVRSLPDPFLPFIPGPGMVPPLLFQRTLQVIFLVSLIALLFNRWVRVSAFLLGSTILIGVLSSKAYYGNNKAFCGLMLLLAGLSERRREPWILRLQLVVVYFGAGLNKLLDPDWRSGLFFENWGGAHLHHPVYLGLASLLPAMVFAKIASWFTIASELGLSGIFVVRRLYPFGIWLSLILHSGMLWFTGSTFGMFFYGMAASMLIFARWPEAPLTVIYDGDCRFCNRVRRLFERFDLEAMFHWQPGAALDSLNLVAGGRTYTGFRAFKMMLLFNPVSYLVTFIILAAPGAGDSRFRNVFVAVLLFLFSPLFAPVGEAIYRLIARNRSRLSCRVA